MLKDCRFGIFNHTAPDNWIPIYLGFGNHLTIKSIYKEKFDEEYKLRNIKSYGDLYQQWIEIMLNIL